MVCSLTFSQDEYCRTAFHLAITSHSTWAPALLGANTDFSLTDTFGFNCIHAAAFYGNEK